MKEFLFRLFFPSKEQEIRKLQDHLIECLELNAEDDAETMEASKKMKLAKMAYKTVEYEQKAIYMGKLKEATLNMSPKDFIAPKSNAMDGMESGPTGLTKKDIENAKETF
jgi:hypothetical protein